MQAYKKSSHLLKSTSMPFRGALNFSHLGFAHFLLFIREYLIFFIAIKMGFFSNFIDCKWILFVYMKAIHFRHFILLLKC
jgi:hypothetical protein